MHRPFSSRRSILLLTCLAATTLLIQAASLQPTQIPAGTTGALGSGKLPVASSATTPQGKILQSALSHETRNTLQQAMDSMDVSTPAH